MKVVTITMIQCASPLLAYSLVAAEMRISRTALSVLDILLSTLALAIAEEKHYEQRISSSLTSGASSSTYTCTHLRGCIG